MGDNETKAPVGSYLEATGLINYGMTNDYMFRAVLQKNEKVLKGLIASLLHLPEEKIITVLVKANLGTRVKRYIDRCGVNKFNFDDKNEIAARVERDYGMFLGLEKEVDLVVNNDEGTNIEDIIKKILSEIGE